MKHSQQTKEKALELFLKGTTLEEIAKTFKVPFETIKQWHKVYKWAAKKTENNRKTTENLQEKVSKEKAEERFDVRKEFIEGYKEAKKLKEEAESTIEKVSTLNVAHKYLEHVGKIDQVYTEQINHTGTVQVIPIFGNLKANVPNAK